MFRGVGKNEVGRMARKGGRGKGTRMKGETERRGEERREREKGRQRE